MATLLTQSYNLNLIPGQNIVIVNAAAYDNSPRLIRFNMYNGSQQIDVSQWSARIEGTRQGTQEGFSTTATVSGSVVSFAITNAMTASSGKHQAVVVFFQGNDRVASATFILNVSPAALDESTPATDEDNTIYQQWLAANTSQVQQNATDIAVLKARMDEFTSLPDGSTTGDAELADIRIGADGKTYPTAGDAVRGQVGDLKSAINDLRIIGEDENPEYVSGYITATGSWGNGECRTNPLSFNTQYLTVVPLADYQCRIAEYSGTTAGTFTRFIAKDRVRSAFTFSPLANRYYVIDVLSVNGTAVSPSTIPQNAITYYESQDTDVTLTLAGKSADAKVVGKFRDDINDTLTNIEDEIFDTELYTDFEIGTYSASDGSPTSNNQYFRTKTRVPIDNFISVYGSGSSSDDHWYKVRWFAYDANGDFVQCASSYSNYSIGANIKNAVPTAEYIAVGVYDAKDPHTMTSADYSGVTITIKKSVIDVLQEKQQDSLLYGVKWGAMGDSYTSSNTLSGQSDTRNYVDLIAEQTYVNVTNLGVSGTGYKRGEDTSKAFYQRALNIPNDLDVLTIFGSGNDQNWSTVEEVGTATDTGTTTLGGCINTTLDNLWSVNPLMRIGIIAPSPWKGYPPDSTSATWMKRYTTLLKNICELRGIPFLDLYHESNLRPWIPAVESALYIDNTHPNTEGHKRIASMVKSFLIKIAS